MASEAAGSIVVGDGITKTASTVTLQGNNGTSALASVESTASALALSVVCARTSDELSARGLAGSSGWGSRSGGTTIVQDGGRSSRSSRSLATQNTSSVIVGGCVTETAATITFESYDSTSTLASVESAASALTFRIASTNTGDELGAGWLARTGSRGRGRSGSTTVVEDWGSGCLTPEDTGSVVIGNTITKAASTITFKGDDGTCTFASVEPTASRATVGIGVARAGNELFTSSLTRNEGCVGEGCSQSDKSNEKGDPASEHDE